MGVGVAVRVADGVRLGVEVCVGVGWAATDSVQPFPSVTLRPKELAGTIPGQAASELRKSKLNVSVSPMSKSTVVRPPGLVHVVGELRSSAPSIV